MALHPSWLEGNSENRHRLSKCLLPAHAPGPPSPLTFVQQNLLFSPCASPPLDWWRMMIAFGFGFFTYHLDPHLFHVILCILLKTGGALCHKLTDGMKNYLFIRKVMPQPPPR